MTITTPTPEIRISFTVCLVMIVFAVGCTKPQSAPSSNSMDDTSQASVGTQKRVPPLSPPTQQENSVNERPLPSAPQNGVPGEASNARTKFFFDSLKERRIVEGLRDFDFSPLHENRAVTHEYLKALLETFNNASTIMSLTGEKAKAAKQMAKPELEAALDRYALDNPDYFGESATAAVSPFLDAIASIAESRRNGDSFIEENTKSFAALTKIPLQKDLMIQHGESDATVLVAFVTNDSLETVKQVFSGLEVYLGRPITNAKQLKVAVNKYKSDVPDKILKDVDEVARLRGAHSVRSRLPEIAILSKTIAASENGANADISKSAFALEIERIFGKMTKREQVEGLATLIYFGGRNDLASRLDDCFSEVLPANELSKVDDSPGGRRRRWYYNSLLDEKLAIMAAAGHYAQVRAALSDFVEPVDETYGGRSKVHLAIAEIASKNYEEGLLHCEAGLIRIDKNSDMFEILRNVFRCIELLGKAGKSDEARRLIEKIPSASQPIAYAYLAKGADDKSILAQAHQKCLSLERGRINYALEQVGVVAAQMDELELADKCIQSMEPDYRQQSPIRIYCEIAKVTMDKRYLGAAKARINRIPARADGARSSAILWIALATISLDLGDAESIRAFGEVNALDPKYRILFNLRLIGLDSMREYAVD